VTIAEGISILWQLFKIGVLFVVVFLLWAFIIGMLFGAMTALIKKINGKGTNGTTERRSESDEDADEQHAAGPDSDGCRWGHRDGCSHRQG
jgi:hypothetical protein